MLSSGTPTIAGIWPVVRCDGEDIGMHMQQAPLVAAFGGRRDLFDSRSWTMFTIMGDELSQPEA